jgi:hypothetical protein
MGWNNDLIKSLKDKNVLDLSSLRTIDDGGNKEFYIESVSKTNTDKVIKDLKKKGYGVIFNGF